MLPLSQLETTPQVDTDETTLPSTIEPPEDILQAQILRWNIDQKIVEKLVQVYKDPTATIPQQNHDRLYSAEIVEDTQWCKILKPSYPCNVLDEEINNNSSISNNIHNYYFGGVDIGWPNPPICNNNGIVQEDPLAVAVYVIVDARTMEVVYKENEWISMAEIPPYVSTYLSFREIDPLEKLVYQQTVQRPELTPSAILVDGNGIFHPRHAGIACVLGVRTEIPTIGIGKTLLYIGNKRDEHSDKEEDEYHWTRSKLDKRIETVLHDVHRRIVCGNEIEKITNGMANNGLILSKGPNSDEINGEASANSFFPNSREKLLEDLYSFCNGIAIPLEAPPNNSNTNVDDRFKILGAALVGHGGSKSSVGSKRPIIVSVGHKLSLAEAASITASLSMFRIPEPVRQADLYGRDLLRERKMM